MIKKILLTVSLLIFSQQLLAKASLGNIRAFVDHDYEEFVTELSFSGSVDLSKIKIKHLDAKIVISLPNTTTEKNNAELKIKDTEVKKITVSKSKKEVTVSVGFKKGIDANNFKGYTRIEKDGKLVRLSLKRNSYIAQQKKIRKELLQPVGLGEEGDEKDIDLETALTESAQEENQTIVLESEEKREEDIPVLGTVKKKKVAATEESLLSRLSLSLGLIFCFAIGLFLFMKWWSRNYKTQDMQSKIRVLTQHHLGPKKTLAIIRVAGEAILIGVTDQNINHIKTLSLLDGEIPDSVPANFQAELNANFEEEPAQEAVVDSFTYGENIKKTITSRLKDLGR